MRTRSAQLRRARSLYAYWHGDSFRLHDFARRLSFAARPIVCELLDFFGEWRTREHAVTEFADYSPRSVNRTISALVKQGLLLAKDSPRRSQDDRIPEVWADWLPAGSFHFSTKDSRYVGSNWSNARLRAVLPNTPQPKIFKSANRAKRLKLRPLQFPDSEFLNVLKARRTHRRFSAKPLDPDHLSQLLGLVWGVRGYVKVPVFGRLALKTSPSGGARHPGEVYVMCLRVKGLKRGIYHYHPGLHQLELTNSNATPQKAWRYCAGQDFVKNAAALFLMTAVVSRTMWKYRHARAYRVILLDAGHLCQTFCLVATWLGLAPFCTAALKDTLIETDLGIDGANETILYVAGVGFAGRGSTAAPVTLVS